MEILCLSWVLIISQSYETKKNVSKRLAALLGRGLEYGSVFQLLHLNTRLSYLRKYCGEGLCSLTDSTVRRSQGQSASREAKFGQMRKIPTSQGFVKGGSAAPICYKSDLSDSCASTKTLALPFTTKERRVFECNVPTLHVTLRKNQVGFLAVFSIF